MNNSPLISIITVSYNAVKTIEDTIISVLNQTYSNIEYIIIDGASTDGTLEVIKKYQDDISIIVSEPDKGIYDAMNKGIERANGELIGIINADDWYEANAVERTVEIYLRGEKKFDVLYGDMLYILLNGKTQKIIPPREVEGLRKKMIIGFASMFIAKKAYEKWGVYDTSFKISGDYDLVLRFYTKGAVFKKMDFIAANFRQGGISTELSMRLLRENMRLRRKNKINFTNLEELYIFANFNLRKKIKKILFKLGLLPKRYSI
jgi:glycosyltransferase, family 2